MTEDGEQVERLLASLQTDAERRRCTPHLDRVRRLQTELEARCVARERVRVLRDLGIYGDNSTPWNS